jgi:hypothetical protein
MRSIVGVIIAAMGALGLATSVNAVTPVKEPFCQVAQDGVMNCEYRTMEQCQAAIAAIQGKGGRCIANPEQPTR